MGTTIRPELSEKNPYWIERHRYYELKHFCLQYPIWKKAYAALDGLSRRPSDLEVFSKKGEISDPSIREHEIKQSQLDEQIKADVQDEQFKSCQLNEQMKDRYFKVGIAAAELLIPLMFYGIWMRKGFKFEERSMLRHRLFLFGE